MPFIFFFFPSLLSWEYDKGLEFLSLEMLCLLKRTNVEGAKTNSQQVPCLPEVVTVYTEVLINKKLPAVHQLMAPLLAFRKKETKHDTLFNCLNIRRQTKRHSNLQGT